MNSFPPGALRDSLKSVVRSLSLLCAVASSTACVSMQVPERFLVVERDCGSLRALTPEESKLWVRDFDDDTKAALPFWKDALKADLIENRGYTLIEEGAINDGAGHEGITMTLEVTLSGRPVREQLSVFVLPGMFGNTVRVVEYVADKDAFDKEVTGVKAAIATLR